MVALVASDQHAENHALIGSSEVMAALRTRIPAVARAQRTTLVTGPTGSGKEMVARALHAQSPRKDRPLITVHCGALPDSLIEAELFGHARGAFTGAHQARTGLIKTASDGTLFLDEVDSLPLAAQAKLLRFLDSGEYRPVGEDRAEFSSSWVIAATNRSLDDRVRAGEFRADLMYRLAVVRLDVPSLHDRGADILDLAEYFLSQHSGDGRRFSEEARRALLEHSWPGNVRELKHRVESAALFSANPTLDAASLNLSAPERPMPRPPAPKIDISQPLEDTLWRMIAEDGLTLSQAMERCERVLLEAALRRENNNRTRAAGRLGIHVRTIFKKLAG